MSECVTVPVRTGTVVGSIAAHWGSGVRVLKAAAGEVLDLAFSPDGRAIAAAIKYHGVFLWNLEAAVSMPVALTTDGDYKGGLGFSADGRSLGWLGPTSRQVYDRDSREIAYMSFEVTRNTHGVTQSADGSRVISQHGLPDYCLIGWRVADGEWVRTWSIPTADLSIERVTISADGRLVAMLTRSVLGKRRFWDYPIHLEVRDAATAAVRVRAEYPSNHRARLLFSPDSRQLVGFKDMTLLVWPVPEDLASLGPPQIVRNNNRKHFTAMAYHPSGRHLYATSNDATVHVFDTATWERTERFRWQLGHLKAVAVAADGTLAAAGSDHGDVVVWDVDL